jgi:hypothetical protein
MLLLKEQVLSMARWYSAWPPVHMTENTSASMIAHADGVLSVATLRALSEQNVHVTQVAGWCTQGMAAEIWLW